MGLHLPAGGASFNLVTTIHTGRSVLRTTHTTIHAGRSVLRTTHTAQDDDSGAAPPRRDGSEQQGMMARVGPVMDRDAHDVDVLLC